jgi:hypothetical protein
MEVYVLRSLAWQEIYLHCRLTSDMWAFVGSASLYANTRREYFSIATTSKRTGQL